MSKYNVAMLLFPELTLQDFVGPYDVFIRADCFTVLTVAANTQPIQAEGGLTLQAQYTFDNCPSSDILFVPGGRGITPLLADDRFLSFLRIRGASAKYVTSVCTGSLLLAAAGLLDGFRATTHWRSLPLLRMFDVEVVEARVVRDLSRITGGGITAGIDFGLQLTAWLGGESMAKAIQLMLEYSPEPPFESGSPATAEPDIVQHAMNKTQASFETRRDIISRITASRS